MRDCREYGAGAAGPISLLCRNEEEAMTVVQFARRHARLFAVVSLVSLATTVMAQQRGHTLVDKVRAANDRFKDVSVAVSEGYTAIPCASGVEGGAMGVHFVSDKLLKADAIDIAHPPVSYTHLTLPTILRV